MDTIQEPTFVAPGKVEVRERSRPAIEGAGEALVRPIAVARCDLDLGMAAGRAPIRGSFALGHECLGEVVEVGARRGAADRNLWRRQRRVAGSRRRP